MEEDRKPPKFRTGDVVFLKSQPGHHITVRRVERGLVDGSGWVCVCNWFVSTGEFESMTFPEEMVDFAEGFGVPMSRVATPFHYRGVPEVDATEVRMAAPVQKD